MSSMYNKWIWVGLAYAMCIVNGIKLTYPFGGVDYRDRADDILDKLRSNLNLNVFQETISNTFNNPSGPQKMYLKNSEGNLFAVDKPNQPVKVLLNETGLELYDPVALSSALEGTCAILSIDYWNYEWCHRKQVSQFHMEQQGHAFTKSPDWSLGKFDRSVFIRENQRNASTPLIKVVDYFKGGQHCDETNDDRSIEIHIQCCEKTHLKNYVTADVYYAEKPGNAATSGPPMPKATLNAIDEPSVCAYKAIVCTPLLCKKPDHINKETTSLVTSEGKVFTEMMKTLNSTCLLRSEVWWTYELCFGKGVRQLRLNTEQSVLPDGNVVQKQVMASQFILGNPQLEVMTNETALVERTNPQFFLAKDELKQPQREEISVKELEIIGSSGLVSPLFKARGKEPKFLTLEYDNGTLCDLHNMNRSTVVEIYCGLSNNIVSIIEDSTCHYRMKVEVTALCALADFQPKKDNVSTITISPVFPRGSEFNLDDLVAAAAESTVNYQVPETRTKVFADGTVIETQAAVFPEKSVTNDAVVDSSPTDVIVTADAGVSGEIVDATEPSEQLPVDSSSVDGALDAPVEDLAVLVPTDDVKYDLTPDEFAESKSTKPPSQLPSDLPYHDDVVVDHTGVDNVVVDEGVQAAPAVEEIREINQIKFVGSAEIDITAFEAREAAPKDAGQNVVVERFQKLLLGLAILAEQSEATAPISRTEYIQQSKSRYPGDLLTIELMRRHAAIKSHWLRHIMNVVDYRTLVQVIDSIPRRPAGRETFLVERMTCRGPRLSKDFVLHGKAASNEDESEDDQAFTEWIDCLKHEENLLIVVEAMFALEEMYE